MRRSIALLFLAIALMAPAVPAAAQRGDALVTVIHGFRGLVADVYLDDERVLTGFRPERLTDPLAIPAGQHEVRVLRAGSPADADAVISAQLTVRGGDRLSAIVHADRDGDAAFSVFREEPNADSSRARVTVRHAAAASPVDVRVDGQALAELSVGDEANEDVQDAEHEVAIAAAGSVRPLIPPADFAVAAGRGVNLYLIGSQDRDSLGWLAQTVRLRTDVPQSVPAGDSGLADPRRSQEPSPALWAGLVAVAAAAVLMRRRLAHE